MLPLVSVNKCKHHDAWPKEKTQVTPPLPPIPKKTIMFWESKMVAKISHKNEVMVVLNKFLPEARLQAAAPESYEDWRGEGGDVFRWKWAANVPEDCQGFFPLSALCRFVGWWYFWSPLNPKFLWRTIQIWLVIPYMVVEWGVRKL